MSLKKKLFGVPATVLGVTLGLLVGGLAATKEIVQKEFPTIGLAIMVATPIVAFCFEQVMSRAFPESYWETLAGRLVKLYRYVINEDFNLTFLYQVSFLVTAESPEDITPETICRTLNAAHGGDPEPAYIGANYVHLRFSGSPALVSVRWYLEVSGEDTSEKSVTTFRMTMEPEVRNLAMRSAKEDIEATIARLNRLLQSLILRFKTPPETLAIADAWFGTSVPPATPLPRKRVDMVTGAQYQIFPGLVHLTGNELSTLGAVFRYVSMLQPPPTPD